MSYLEKVEFLKLMMINMKDNDEYYREMLYDDLRYLKNHCYKELMDNSIKIEECFHLYDSVLSKEHGVSVFHLQGEPFNALVREYIVTDPFLEDFENGLLNKDLVAYSFSYIGDEHIGTFYNDNDRKKGKFVLLLHSHINKDNIIYVSKEDAFTTENAIFDVSINVNELHTIDSLLNETEKYNELVKELGEYEVDSKEIPAFHTNEYPQIRDYIKEKIKVLKAEKRRTDLYLNQIHLT